MAKKKTARSTRRRKSIRRNVKSRKSAPKKLQVSGTVLTMSGDGTMDPPPDDGSGGQADDQSKQ